MPSSNAPTLAASILLAILMPALVFRGVVSGTTNCSCCTNLPSSGSGLNEQRRACQFPRLSAAQYSTFIGPHREDISHGYDPDTP